MELEVPRLMHAARETAQPETPTPERRTAPTAWFAGIACAVLALVVGLVLGYVLSGRPDIATIQSRLARNTPGALRLQIDYQLRERTACEDSASPCNRRDGSNVTPVSSP